MTETSRTLYKIASVALMIIIVGLLNGIFAIQLSIDSLKRDAVIMDQQSNILKLISPVYKVCLEELK